MLWLIVAVKLIELVVTMVVGGKCDGMVVDMVIL